MSKKSEVRAPSQLQILTPTQAKRVNELFGNRQEKYAVWYGLHVQAEAARTELKEAEEAHWNYLQGCNERLPLIDGPEKSPSESSGQDVPPAGPPVDPEAWRATPLFDVLKKSKKHLRKLQGAGVTTLGQLQDFSQKKSEFQSPLREIAGVGEKAAEEIEDDVLAWWREDPEYTKTSEAATAPAPASDVAREVNTDLVQTINACKDKVIVRQAIAGCDDLALLQGCLDGGLTGDWRRAAVSKRVNELKNPKVKKSRKSLKGGLDAAAE